MSTVWGCGLFYIWAETGCAGAGGGRGWRGGAGGGGGGGGGDIKSRDTYPAASAILLEVPPIAACASAAKSTSPVRRCSINSDTCDCKAWSKALSRRVISSYLFAKVASPIRRADISSSCRVSLQSQFCSIARSSLARLSTITTIFATTK